MPVHVRPVLALALSSLLAAALAPAPARAEPVEIRIGTLAPKSSPWGKVFQVWQDAVAERSEGEVKLVFFWNGSQGDDAAMIDKMKSGAQLDGAAVSALGLGRVWRQTLALQIPGLFRTYDAIDKARAALRPEIDREFAAAGFVLSGFGDVGISHTMSKGFAVRVPEDLRGQKPVMWQDDVIGPVLFRTIGGVTPVSMTVPTVLPALGNDSVNIVAAPSLAATQLQWASRLDHIVTTGGSVTIGGLVLKKSTLDRLPPDQRELLRETGQVASSALRDRIRGADATAFASLKKRMTNVELTPEEEGKWADVLRKTAEALGQGTFDPELLKRLAAMKGLPRVHAAARGVGSIEGVTSSAT